MRTANAMTWYDLPVEKLAGVGPARAKALRRLGIETLMGLLRHIPRRYEDYSNTKPIKELRDGEEVTVFGRVIRSEIRSSSSDPLLWVMRAELTDGTGSLSLIWFARTRRPNIRPKVSVPKAGDLVFVSGRVSRRYGILQMKSPEYESADEGELLNVGRIVPVYPACEGLGQKLLRLLIKRALELHAAEIPEFLPPETMSRLGLLPRGEAFRNIHFPRSSSLLDQARFRLGFEEVFLLQVGLGIRKEAASSLARAIRHKEDGPLVERFLSQLPFPLTEAQRRAISEIGCDMERDRPMNRLLQGDVGSGKTVVAAFALAKTVENGCQGALMAPTEILAEQHFLTLSKLFSGMGIRLALLLGGQARSEREEITCRLASGEVDVVVGTHALLQEGIGFLRLGLAIVDEQHRFGVGQRLALKGKGTCPHVLVMSATPIPRSLALTIYADLDISIIDELPKGRMPVETHWLPKASQATVWRFVREEINKGHQAYIICPLVEESEALDLKAATAEFERLENEVFPDLRVGLLHGRMNPEEKNARMTDFKEGRIDVLVSTSVVEVGVDVPNATVMVIEDAERFGLAQLHQLRGRVGRGGHKSYCILIASGSSPEARRRLSIMSKTNDGFAIAEEDLRLRGPGEFLGLRQHGLGDLDIRVDLITSRVLACGHKEALRVMEKDPRLECPEYQALRAEIRRRFGGRLELVDVG